MSPVTSNTQKRRQINRNILMRQHLEPHAYNWWGVA